MNSQRRARLESVIQSEVSQLVSRGVKDPRVPNVTITRVELTEDGSQATLMVMILGQTEVDTPQMEDCLIGLNSAAGFLKKNLAKALKVRQLPRLVFRADRGLNSAYKVYDLLNQVKAEKEAAGDLTDGKNDNADSKEQ